MPGKRITDKQVTEFSTALAKGETVAAASAIAGFSKASGDRILARLGIPHKSGATAGSRDLGGEKLLEIPEPIPRSALSAVALDCLDDFARFRARFMGRISSPWQEHAANTCKEKLWTPVKEYGVVNCPPGSGKSTLFTHDICAWLTAQSRSIRGFIGSATQTTANSYTGRLRSTLERPIPLLARDEDIRRGLGRDADSAMCLDYGRFKPIPLPDQSNPPWSKSQFTVAQVGQHTSTGEKEATWAAFGEDTRFLGWRVNFAVWDDVVTQESFRTEEAIAAQRRWWQDEAETRLEPGGLLILQGQRLNAEDLYRFCLDLKTAPDEEFFELTDDGDIDEALQPKYFHIVYPAHNEANCNNLHLRTSPPFDPNNPESPGCLLDPARLPWRELVAIQKQPMSNYRVVYQQEDVDPEEVLVPKHFIDGGDYEHSTYIGCWDDERGIGQPPPELTKAPGLVRSVVTVDPSPTKYWAIIWWLYYQSPATKRLMGYRYAMDLVRKPMRAPDFLDYNADTRRHEGLMVEWVQRAELVGYPITHLIVEKNAAQRFMLQYEWFQRFCSDNNVRLMPHSTNLNKADEEFGIGVLRPHYEFGRVRLPGTSQARDVFAPMVYELTHYPEASTDDTVLSNWFLEFNLQYIVPKTEDKIVVYNDIPSWLMRNTSYA